MMICDSYLECNGKKLVYYCIRFKIDFVEVCVFNFCIVCGKEFGMYIMM